MGSRAEEMIRVAVDSFAARDVAPRRDAGRARRADRPGEPPGGRAGVRDRRRPRRPALGPADADRLALLERIGDHAVDIGEQTVYLVTGEFREYTDASRPSLAGA